MTVPLKIDDDALQQICDELPAKDWLRVENAWRQHRQNEPPRYMQYIHATNEEKKRLGLFWQRLIAQDFITEDDALLLAENFFQGSGGYSDETARDMVKKILSAAADRYRTKATAARGELKIGEIVRDT